MNALRIFLAAGLLCASANGGVVINEVFYNAPEDIEDLEYIELYNAAETAADISGWHFTKGIKFTFPASARIPANGFLVLCRNAERFTQYYRVPIAGTFAQKLSNDGEHIELTDGMGRMVDSVSYGDRAPWPTGPDGLSGSLERICPFSPGNEAANWSSSPLSADRVVPGGTPGRVNSSYSPELPPVITTMTFAPQNPAPGEAVTVTAEVRKASNSPHMTLLFEVLGTGGAGNAASLAMREASPGIFTGTIPGQLGDRVLRVRVGARTASGATRFFPAPNEPRPAASVYISSKPNAGKIPLAFVLAPDGLQNAPRQRRWRGPRSREEESPPSPHNAAFIYYDPATNKFEVYDYVQIASRPGGWKVRFNKDQPLREMSAVNITFETDRAVLAEPLAYELYRRCGMASEQSWQVRLSLNGQPLGFHLLFEQPNRAFLRRNQIRDDGNLYKILWYEQGVVGQHEKKTNTREGHADILALVQALESTQGNPNAQWEVIKKNFDVKQVATYFAVNTVLSHWDGFFNNYFTYHDVNGTGKWTMYPWDQDQTWGIMNHDPESIFYQMPITFGKAGDVPPGRGRRSGGNRFGFGDGPGWWRPGGYFSAPLLANERFRPLFLARTREILENIYTPEKINPLIDKTAENLREEVKLRAELTGSDAKWELQQFDRNVRAFRTHLIKRREFLLAEPEIQNALRMR